MTKLTISLAATLAAVSAPLAAQETVVDLDTALRCSAAFAIVATEQNRGVASSIRDYPPVNERGREFFVQTGARLIDERKVKIEEVRQLLLDQMQTLQASAAAASDPKRKFDETMVPCLSLLDATIPASR